MLFLLLTVAVFEMIQEKEKDNGGTAQSVCPQPGDTETWHNGGEERETTGLGTGKE